MSIIDWHLEKEVYLKVADSKKILNMEDCWPMQFVSGMMGANLGIPISIVIDTESSLCMIVPMIETISINSGNY